MDYLEPFESPKLLVDSGKESLAEFETRCADFIKICTYEVVEHVDPKTKEKVVKLRFKHRIPGRLRTLVHHIVSDFRHALDQAVCDGAIQLGRTDGKGVYFPFGRDETDLAAEINKKLRNVHPDLADYVRTLKPYVGENGLLCAICQIAGPNKHQRIARLSLNNPNVVIRGDGLFATGPFKISVNQWNDLRNELEYARIGPGGHLQIQLEVPIEIVLGTGEAPLTGPAATILRDFAGMVERIVLGIESETIRIKGLP
jgi:hypothetical protein